MDWLFLLEMVLRGCMLELVVKTRGVMPAFRVILGAWLQWGIPFGGCVLCGGVGLSGLFGEMLFVAGAAMRGRG